MIHIHTLKLGQDTGDSAGAAAAGHGNVVLVLLSGQKGRGESQNVGMRDQGGEPVSSRNSK